MALKACSSDGLAVQYEGLVDEAPPPPPQPKPGLCSKPPIACADGVDETKIPPAVPTITPPPGGVAPPAPRAAGARTGPVSSPELRRDQQLLIALGYDVGPHGADGRMGPQTRTAMTAAKADHNLPPDANLAATRGALERDLREQQNLLKQVYPDLPPGFADGHAGASTTNAIVRFQTQHGIQPADGRLTPETRQALADSATEAYFARVKEHPPVDLDFEYTDPNDENSRMAFDAAQQQAVANSADRPATVMNIAREQGFTLTREQAQGVVDRMVGISLTPEGRRAMAAAATEAYFARVKDHPPVDLDFEYTNPNDEDSRIGFDAAQQQEIANSPDRAATVMNIAQAQGKTLTHEQAQWVVDQMVGIHSPYPAAAA